MILQSSIPYDPLSPHRLPGVAPLGSAPWLYADDAYAAQMAERDRLLSEVQGDVMGRTKGSGAAEAELLDKVLRHLPSGFTSGQSRVTRPDGVTVDLSGDSLLAAGRLVQEDLCLMERGEDGQHCLTAAVLCFPASWRLAEKLGRPLTGIHTPVPEYDGTLAKRVQRLFDGLQIGRPVWRFNALWYSDPALHQPRSAANPRPVTSRAEGGYLRSERQCLVRLPETRAVVFSIHTYVLKRDAWVIRPFPE